MSNSTSSHSSSHSASHSGSGSLQYHPAPPRQPGTRPAAQQTNQETGSSGRQPPRLHSTTRTTRHDFDDDDATPVPLPARHADTLMALRGQLHALHDLEHDRAPDAVIAFFDALKAAEKDNILPEVIRDYRHADELHGFVNALTLFLGRLEGALRDAQSPLHLSLADLPVGQLRTICLGLAVCANPLAAMPFSATRRKEAMTSQRDDASAALRGITDVLLKLVDQAGLPDASKSVSVALDIMNWLTRGLKAGLLGASPAMTKMAPRFVEAFLTWSTPPVPALSADAAVTLGGPPAKAAPQFHREPHQIGKCAAQVNPILQFQLLGPAAVGMLRKLAFNLGSDAFLKSLQTPPMQGVALINLTNMVKDGIAAGLLPLSDQRLPAMVEGLLALILKMPASEMVVNGGTVLGNVGNFLRELIELELQEPAPFCVSTLRHALEACKKVVDCTQEATSLGSQSTVNLLSFMKAADKWLAKTGAAAANTGPANGGPAKAGTANAYPAQADPARAGYFDTVAAEALQPALLAAATKLINRACALAANSFSAWESLGGLMAALGYFAEHHVAMPARAIDLVRALAALIAEVETTHWERQSRGALLQAIDILIEQRLIPLKQSQGALRSLLGPCPNPGGFYTKQDLSAAASKLGPRREAVPVLLPELLPEFVPEPQAKPEPASSPSPEPEPANPVAPALPAAAVIPAALPPRPGFTEIVTQQKAKAKPAKKKAKARNREGAGEKSASASSSPATTASATPSGSASTTAAPAPRNEFAPASRIVRSRFADTSSALVVKAPEVVSRTQNATQESKEKRAAAAREKPVPAEQKTDAPLPPSTTSAPSTSATPEKQPPSAGSKKGAAANPPHQPEPGAGPATAGSKAKPSTTKQPPTGIAPQTKWFDQVAKGAASLPKLQQLAQANPELLNARDKAGRNALFYAITRGKAAVVTWLMAQPGLEAIPRRFVDTLLAAIAPATLETVQALVAFVTLAITRQDFSNTELEQILTRRLGKQPWLKAVLEAVAAKGDSATLPAAGKAEVRASPAQAESAQASAASASQASDALQGMTIKELEHRATALDSRAAQFELGRRYRTGNGVTQNYPKALEWFGKAAAQGHAEAQLAMGMMYAQGLGVEIDHGKAAELYAKAGSQGLADAQFNLGCAYLDGLGLEKNDKKAFDWFERAATQGHADSQYNLGRMCDGDRGVPKDARKAAEWYGKAATQGHAGAQFCLGLIYLTGEGVQKDKRKASALLGKAAAQGNTDAQYTLGVLYETGDGVEQDEKTAVEWYDKAAAQGHANAQYRLGLLYANGEGVPRDRSKSVALFGESAALGHADAQFALGSLYQAGIEVKKDVRKAVEWYVKAAEQGHADAQCNLGAMYAHGNGVPKDETLAVEWFAKAAAQGHPEAQCNLGTMYANGSGVPKNERKAAELYGMAAAQGNIQAQQNLEVLAKRARGLPTD